uniref:TtsA-like Glycoside hydrolase family 108 domain-containing protein n=1 Tax=Dictyoglomus thermophilum TaxID=14 RepID=A0A7V3ZJQ2_DICTH
MAEFNYGIIKEWILEIEGGYVNDPRDPGGETKFGISKRSYPDLDIKKITIEKAMEIYRKNFWDPLPLENLPFSVAFVIFDTSINTGKETALVLMKNVKYDPVKEPIKFVMKYLGLREKYYTRLANFNYFGRGWINRIAKLKDKFLELYDKEVR